MRLFKLINYIGLRSTIFPLPGV